MDYQLHDFIPLYNQIQTTSFDKDINSLTEFVKYKLSKEELFPQHPGDLMLHQKLLSSFLNPYTSYDGLLLVHEMGTGKTCTAVAVAEEFIKYSATAQFPSTSVKNIIVLTKGKGLQNNFINEVANVCTGGQYLEGLDKYIRNRNKYIKKNVKVNYTFDTFEIFSKNLKTLSNHKKTMLYENSLFIVDEAHNLRMSSDPEESNIYREIYGLFKLLKRRKILLLTGTPMKDQPEEIVNLLNLILREDLTIQDLNKPECFKQKISGYVSYLRAMMSDINREEKGQIMGTLQYLKIYPVIMDQFQSNAYMTAKQKDDKERSLFYHSRQASLMVFPDGTYGKEGFEKNVVQRTSGYRFNTDIQGELQKQLPKYSVKYADLLKKLQNDYYHGRLSFVFSEFVKGSGLLVLSLLLELNGYIRAIADGNFSKKHKRYVIFTNETSTDSRTRQLISIFNNPKNIHGEYISVIIGSRVIMEGYSFKNIQSEYILTPHWNYSETSQIIARGLRLGSHNDLIKSGIEPKVTIYHYASFPKDQPITSSIDLHMYEISEEKDFKIQKIIRLLKETAFDCSLNKERNTVVNASLENTRGCEYTSCEYHCDNSNPIAVPSNDRNFQLLYFKTSKDYYKIKNIILKSIINFPITIEELMVKTNHSLFEIANVLHDLYNSREILFTRPEGTYYLSNMKNLFYASKEPFSHSLKFKRYDDPLLLNFYLKFITIFKGKSVDELIYNNQSKFMVSLVDKIFTSKNLVELQQYMVQLPLYLQEKLLCYSITTKYKNTPHNFTRDMVLNNFKLYYKIKENNAFVWLNPYNYHCNTNFENVRSWHPCNSLESKQIEQLKKERTKVKIVSNPYGYIGLLNRTTNDFCLRKIDEETSPQDKRKRNVGKRCQNWKKKDLVDLVANRLEIQPDEDFEFDSNDMEKMKNNPKFENLLNTNNGTLRDYKRVAFWDVQDISYLCTKIMQNFMDKKMVIDDPNCGTSKKTR